MSIIKGLQALRAPRRNPAALPKPPLDLTRPNSGVTPEERAALIGAGMVIGGQQPGRVISLEDYRWKRQWFGGKPPRPTTGSSGCMDPRD